MVVLCSLSSLHFFFFNDTATTEIYTLSLHDALPICSGRAGPLLVHRQLRQYHSAELRGRVGQRAAGAVQDCRRGSASAAEQGGAEHREQGSAERGQDRTAGRLEQTQKA